MYDSKVKLLQLQLQLPASLSLKLRDDLTLGIWDLVSSTTNPQASHPKSTEGTLINITDIIYRPSQCLITID